MDEKYDLKWKTYSEHLVGVFKELGEEGHFADVTLVSDDQIQTPAHKVVLSACSSVLKTLLVNNPHSHPLLYLRGIKQTELQAILKFMYFGETQICENRINDFVSFAKDLEVKEISEEQSEGAEQYEEETVECGPTSNLNNEGTDKIGDEVIYEIKTEDGNKDNVVNAITKPLQNSRVVNTVGSLSCPDCDWRGGTKAGLRMHWKTKHEGEITNATIVIYSLHGFFCFCTLLLHFTSKHAGVRYSCTVCDYQSTQQSHLTVHINSKHEGMWYLCSECPDRPSFTQKGNLQEHTDSIHLGVKYPCSECDYQATQLVHVKTHFDNKHAGVRYPCPHCEYKATDKVRTSPSFLECL